LNGKSIAILAGISVAVIISVIAISTHLRLSAVEGNEKNSNESARQVANEVLTGQPSSSPHQSQIGSTPTESKLSFENLKAAGSPYQGNPTARVTLVEFGDFQCEFCARFAKDTESQIQQNYVETGKVNMVFKHLVHYGSTSDLAASASQCANDQGKFWDYYHILYTNQDAFMLGQDTSSALKNLASNINGLDATKFNACFDSGIYKDIAKNDTLLAGSLGFNDTPSFLIENSDGTNQQTLVGAYPFDTFKVLLDKEIGAIGTGELAK